MPTDAAAPPWRRRLAPPAVALACALAAGAAAAQGTPVYLGGALDVTHDSNLLRLSNGQAAPPGTVKSDRITSTSLLAGVDQPLGRQKLHGNLTLRDQQFARNTAYDNHGYAAATALDWSTVGHWSGSLGARASRNLSSFNLDEIGLLTQKNLESARAFDAAVRWGLADTQALELAGATRRIRNSLAQDRVQARNFEQDQISLGWRWQPMAASRLGVALRRTQGRYPRFRKVGDDWLADRFDRHEVDLSGGVQFTGNSALDLRLSSGRTRYDLATQRDYSGLTGAATWAWTPRGKTRLSASLSRDSGLDSYAVIGVLGSPGTVDYSRLNTALRLKLDHDTSARLALSLVLSHAERELVRTLPGLTGAQQDEGRNRHDALSLGLRWTPRRSLLAGCDLGQERQRSRGGLSADFDGRRFGCFAQFTLQ